MAPKSIPDEFVPLFIHYRRDRAIRRVGNDGELMYLRALAHCRSDRTDGRIEDFDLADLGAGMDNPEGVAASLVLHGLWIKDGDGWLIRSWEKWNAWEAARSESGLLGNHLRWHVSRGVESADCDLCIAPDSHPTRTRSGSDIAPESHPESQTVAEVEGERDIEIEGEGELGARKTRTRATRLDRAFIPSPDARAAILAEHPDIDLRREHAKFVDHWTAVSGQRGTKLDWDATWRNWMRRAADDYRRRPNGKQQETDDMFAAALVRARAADAAIEGEIL